MKPTRHRLSLLPALLALTVLAGCGGGTETAPPGTEGDATTPVESAEQESPIEEHPQEPTVAPLEHETVRVFFPSNDGDGLVAEEREIFQTTTPGDRAKQIINGLIDGPETEAATRAVPRGTRLRQVYVLESGVAYLDFSRDLTEGLGGGSAREMMAVYAIVDSVTRNIPEIRAVGLLIEGRVAETLNGHLDLRYPLHPNYKIVLTDAGVERDDDAEPPVRIAGAP